MAVLGVGAGLVLILVVLMDAFEAIVQPRRVTHRYRLSRLYYRNAWTLWRLVAGRLSPGRVREAFLSTFGPLSMLMLFVVWVLGLVLGFALLEWSLATPLQPLAAPGPFSTYLYLSGVTFFTLGYGDVTAAGGLGRALTVLEAGLGFGFLAVVIGYLPVLYQAFSGREVSIGLLDARAGSPPSAAQFLVRLSGAPGVAAADPFLAEWEHWSAELLGSHLSFPVLSYYRSQHDNQSWLAALTAVLDTCTFLIAGVKGNDPYQAQLTFAMARHAAVDLALVFNVPPRPPDPDRLPPERLQALRGQLRQAGLSPREGEAADARLAELRAMYEPFVNALAHYFVFTLPPILPDKPPVDNWQTSPWTRRTAGIGKLQVPEPADEHFR